VDAARVLGDTLLGPGRALRGALRNEGVRRLSLAWASSRTSEWAFQVVLAVYAYESGGALAVGVAGFARMVPAALASFFGAVLADRFARERVLRTVEAARGALAAGCAVAVGLGAPAVLVYGLAALHGIVSAVSQPAVFTLLPSLVRTPEELVTANAAVLTLQGLGALVGPVAGGVLVAAAGPAVGFAAAAGACLLATMLLAGLRVEGGSLWRAARGRRLGDVLGGFLFVARAPQARLIIGLFGAQTLVRGALTVLIVVLALDVLGLDQSWVGFLTAALGVGGLVGALSASRLAGRSLTLPFLAGLAVWGAPIAVIGLEPDALLALGALVVVGFGDAVLDVSGYTLLQRIVPDGVLARVFGVHNAITFATVGAGSLAAPAVIAALGTRGALIASGLLLPVLAGLFAVRVRSFDGAEPPPFAQLALVRGVPMFARLSVAATEQVAARLLTVDAPAGTTLMRRGDAGDRFYILAEGAVELVRDGRLIAIDRPGDYLGEIALLRDVPRTTTVTARVDSRLYALERADFLDAVSGHSAGLAAAQAVVADRLPRAIADEDAPTWAPPS
jgi:MFS family permease